MNVVFDGICLGDGPITGVARAFLTALQEYARRWPCTLLLPEGALDPALPLRIVSAPRTAFARQLRLPALLRALRADLLHSSVLAVPWLAPCPTLATAHDLPWQHPELGEATSLRQRAIARLHLRRATVVIAPSTQTLLDVRATSPHAASRTTLIPHSTLSDAAPTAPELRRGPFLSLGDARPRKNRARVQQAHALARAQCADLPELEFVGPPEAYLHEADKQQRLRTCRAAVQCSRFEGFGLPVLEALAHAAPLVCSAIAPHREIAAQAARFVDPDATAAMAQALLDIHRDAQLRQQLAAAGWQRAQEFAPARQAAAWRTLHEAIAR